jgi:RHS repeat-associated protein
MATVFGKMGRAFLTMAAGVALLGCPGPSDNGMDAGAGAGGSGGSDAGTSDGGAKDGGPGDLCAGSSPPMSPTQAAPALDPTIATDFAAAVKFLFEGSSPIQTGVAAGAVDLTRVGVLRGRVLGRDGAPLPCVEVSIAGHPELGSTRTRSDGAYDLAVNGGTQITAAFAAAGFGPVQRRAAPRALDYTTLPDVVLVARDAASTVVSMDAGPQVARGSKSSDASGARTATLLFPAGVQASLKMGDGSTQPLSSITVRATELTVGASGPQAMPASLPPQSAYTYAVELSADEAVAAGAAGVDFTKPVAFYVENFLGFPVGGPVPAGYYDAAQGAWVASESGRIVGVLSTAGGMAALDVDGSGNAADAQALALLGVTDDERRQIATLYQDGASLWRVPIAHFSFYDLNWAGPDGADGPAVPSQDPGDLDDPCEEEGQSAIECQNQILGEDLRLAGVPFHLSYRSDRVPGRLTRSTLRIPLSSDVEPLPPEVTAIHVRVDVAGREFQKDFAPGLGVVYPFSWDGKDAYGRVVQGPQPVSIEVSYASSASYYPTATFGDVADPTSAPLGPATREDVLGVTTWQVTIGGWTALPESLGGWSASVHHVYDPRSGRVWRGDGGRYSVGRSTGALGVGLVIETAVGTGGGGSDGDGGPATAASLAGPKGLAVLPDGSLIVADTGNDRVRRVTPGGIISAFAGTGSMGSSGDGGPAVNARFDQVVAVAAAPNGSVYVAEPARIRVVDTGGTIHAFAGTGVMDATGDGGPATAAAVQPTDLAVGPDGSVYLRDQTKSTVRRIDPGGVITTVAGGGTSTADDAPALQADLSQGFGGLAVGPDGSIYVTANQNQVRRIAGGRVTPFAGQPASGFSGDGAPAVDAQLYYPSALALGPDGSLYIGDDGNERVRVVGPDGVITTFAGDGTSGYLGDGGSPQIAEFYSADALAVTPDGRVYIADAGNSVVRVVSRVTAASHGGQFYVPSQDGREVWLFDAQGRHLQTVDAVTGAVRWQFQYDGAGLLVGVADGNGNVTKIARSGTTQVTITSPYGQTTTLGLDANGYLATLTDPAGATVTLTSSSDGLLRSETDALGNEKTFGYDAATGRLTSDTDAEGNATTLARTDQPDGSYAVASTTPLGRKTTYAVQTFGLFGEGLVTQWTNTDPAGHTMTAQLSAAAVSVQAPDGTTITVDDTPDPRFGMDYPLVSTQLDTPGGYEQDSSQSRSVVLATQGDPLPVKTYTESDERTGAMGGVTSVYDGATRTFTRTSDGGLVTVARYDAAGHLLSLALPGRAPIVWAYDGKGRPTSATWASRVYTYAYDPATGQMSSMTNPLQQTTSFGYDGALRPTIITRPDGKSAALAWYPNGWLETITPPGKAAHALAYRATGLLSDYTPPAVQAGTNGTHYDWDADHALTKITRPDGVTLAYGYDTAGRLTGVAPSNGPALALGYDATTGHLTSIAGPGSESLALAWDGMLNTGQTWSGPVAGDVAFSYSNWVLLASESVDGDGPVSYGYDADFQLVVAGDLLIGRDPATGLPAGSTLGGVEDTIGYDPSYGERATYEADTAAGPVYAVSYTRDALGRVAQIDETLQSDHHVWGYGYDTAGRLQTVTRDGAAWATYAHDDNGNRLSRTDGAGNATTGAYDAQDRQTSWGAATFAWGADGELQGRTDAGGTTTYTYDAFGNLTHVALGGGTAIDYVVDGAGRRVGKKVNGALVQGLLYRDGLRVAAELDATGKVVSRFVYGALGGAPAYMIKGGVEYRILSDHLGSPRLVVSSADGSVAQRIDYDELGNVIQDTAPGFQPFGFAGGLYDRDTGLLRFGARDYDPTTGRWTAKDPVRFGGGEYNLYVYAHDDPVNLSDATGLTVTCVYNQTTGTLTCTADNPDGGTDGGTTGGGTDGGTTGGGADGGTTAGGGADGGTFTGNGYSGNGAGLNNPGQQATPNVGPIPAGTYTMGNPYNSAQTGPNTITLTPQDGTNTFGRSAFRIHGDNSAGNNSASHGCIIMPPSVRQQIINAGGGTLTVVPGQ